MRRGILASIEELHSLRGRLGRKPFDAIYHALRQRCSLILESSPITETQWQNMWQQGVWGSAITAARTAQGRILDLLIAHHVDNNAAYRDRAAEELNNLIAWSTWVDPCHNHQPVDLCTAEAAVAAVLALDWLWEEFTLAQRTRVIEAIRQKAIDPYHEAVKNQAFWYDCYHSWNAVVNSGIGLAGLALGDKDKAAQKAYKLARKGLKRFLGAFGKEGGWDEGTGYWGYAMRYLLLLGEACSRLADDQSIFHARGIDATGRFPVYFTPNGFAASFGDNPSVPLYGTFYLLARHFALPEMRWWLDTYSFHHDVSTSGYSAAGLALLFRPVDAETPREPKMSEVKVFNEIGWAAMADSWPKPRFYVAAKTGDLSANHSQRDMNSIQLQVDGEMMLTDIGHAPYSKEYFSEARGDFYEVQARAHNTIVVADEDHQIDARGTIDEATGGKNFRWLVCNAQKACGEGIRFYRHLVMIVEPGAQLGHMLVVLDELALGAPEKVELFWHSGAKIDLDADETSGTITGRRTSLHFALASTTGMKLTCTSRRLDARRGDHVLCASAGVIDKAMMLSVFSRRQLAGEVRLAETGDGVEIKAGEVMLKFKSSRRHLQLDLDKVEA